MSKKSRFTKDMNDFQRFMFSKSNWNVQLGGWIKYLSDCTAYSIILDMPWKERIMLTPYEKDENMCYMRTSFNPNMHPIIYTFPQLRHRLSRMRWAERHREKIIERMKEFRMKQAIREEFRRFNEMKGENE